MNREFCMTNRRNERGWINNKYSSLMVDDHAQRIFGGTWKELHLIIISPVNLGDARQLIFNREPQKIYPIRDGWPMR